MSDLVMSDLTNYEPDQKLLDRIENDFTYHAPSGDQAERYIYLRDKAKELALVIATLTPPSREQSVAFTHLEAVVWSANAAIARNEKAGK